MRTALFALIFLFITGIVDAQQAKSFYDFSATTIDGKPYPFSELKGKKILIVNTASKCGLTPQYTELQELYAQFGGDTFVIIGFPANNFGSQEPGSNSEIAEFCSSTYSVTFPMMEKISVKGNDIDPVYAWLTQKSENGVMDADVKWNFQKFLIDENGNLVDVVMPNVSPKCEKILNWLSGKQ